MVREPVVPFGDTNLRICAEVQLASQHESDNACQVSAESKPLQLIHQLHVFVEAFRNSLWPIQRGQLRFGAAFSSLYTALHFANRVNILRDSCPVARPKPALDTVQIVQNRIQNALVLPGMCGSALGGSTVAEQTLEDDPGIILCGQRRRWRSPRERVQVDTAIAVFALAGEEVQIDRKFERG